VKSIWAVINRGSSERDNQKRKAGKHTEQNLFPDCSQFLFDFQKQLCNNKNMKITSKAEVVVVKVEKNVGKVNLELDITEAAMLMGLINQQRDAAAKQVNHQNVFERRVGRPCGAGEVYDFCCALFNSLDNAVDEAKELTS
jgi:hypothetical protein